MNDDGTTRRGFMELAGSVVVLGGVDGAVAPQLEATQTGTDDESEFDIYGLVLGSRPSREEIQVNWDTYRFVHIDEVEGVKSYITHRSNGWVEIPLPLPETKVDEVRVEDPVSFFDHTFARPEAPDDKNWLYTTADVTKQGPEVELAATTTLESTQRGNYPPGSESIPGVAGRVTGTPTGGRGDMGYFDDDDGIGAGEDATDSYVLIRKGGTEAQVYRPDFNGHVPSERVWVRDYPVITRFPGLWYGEGPVEIKAMLPEGDTMELKTLHTFTPENTGLGAGTIYNQPNLPITFETSSLAGGSLRANACHYEFGESKAETRINGEHFTGVSVGSTGWTPLLNWRKRANWEMVNVKPLQVVISAASADVKLELQLNPTLTGASFGLPTHTTSDETAVEVDTSGSIDTNGERRWTGFSPAGQGNSMGDLEAATLNFNLPAAQTVTLAAQGVGGTATVSGSVNWQEFF